MEVVKILRSICLNMAVCGGEPTKVWRGLEPLCWTLVVKIASEQVSNSQGARVAFDKKLY